MIGDFAAGDTIDFKFTTRRFSTGVPYTLAGTPSLSVYKSNDASQSAAGVTLTVDFDSVTGLNHVRITTASDGTFYSAGGQFNVVIAAGTIDSVSVVGEVVGRFTLQGIAAGIAANTSALSTIAGYIDTEVAAILAAVDTEVAAIKAKTDNLPAAPAAVSDIPTAIQNADALLNRDMATGTDSGSPTVRTVRQALRFLRNKWTLAGGTLTVTKEDDTTASWTAAVTATAGADPVTASDPAS